MLGQCGRPAVYFLIQSSDAFSFSSILRLHSAEQHGKVVRFGARDLCIGVYSTLVVVVFYGGNTDTSEVANLSLWNILYAN